MIQVSQRKNDASKGVCCKQLKRSSAPQTTRVVKPAYNLSGTLAPSTETVKPDHTVRKTKLHYHNARALDQVARCLSISSPIAIRSTNSWIRIQRCIYLEIPNANQCRNIRSRQDCLKKGKKFKRASLVQKHQSCQFKCNALDINSIINQEAPEHFSQNMMSPHLI